MTSQTNPADHELIEAAAHVARTRRRGDNHTVAAAARVRDGRIVTAVNAYHAARDVRLGGTTSSTPDETRRQSASPVRTSTRS